MPWPIPVIASEAKQSIARLAEPWIASSHSLLAMTLIQFRILAAHSARGLHEPCPSNERKQGMPGACCTRGLVCKRWSRGAHEHTGTAGALRHSLRNGLTAYAELPGDEFVLPPSLPA